MILRFVIIAFLSLSVSAQESSYSVNQPGALSSKDLEKRVGVTEKLGTTIDLSLQFNDEDGKLVSLKEIVNGKPTLLLLVFYSCPTTCSIMMGELGNALAGVSNSTEYQVITISFDDEEGPLAAKRLKTNFIHLPGDNFPENKWKFLWGHPENMKILTKSLGYNYFKLEKHNFVHPNVLISIGSEGKIIRYLHGPNFLPFDISMAIVEATKGTPATSIKKILSYCFSYDSKGKKYVFSTFKVVGTSIILTLLFFFFFLLRGKKGNPADLKNERLKNREDIE